MKLLAASKPQIQISPPPSFHVFGLTFDTYILFSTAVAAVVVLYLTTRLRSTATAGVPGKLQMLFEYVVDQVTELTSSTMGEEGGKWVPLGVMLFFFILICNWMEFLPSSLQVGVSPDLLPPPTSDINLPAAMAVFVFVLITYVAFKNRGFRGYFRHYTQPMKVMTPINMIEEITKPITLTLRLFGNIFAGTLMITVVAVVGNQLLGAIGGGVATFAWSMFWKPFGLLIGAIQALIFPLLTVMYLGMASAKEH